MTAPGSDSDGLTFGLLGPLQASHDGLALQLGGRQQRAVLALLLAKPGSTVSVDRLADSLWGEHVPTSCVVTLQTTDPAAALTLWPRIVQAVADDAPWIVTDTAGVEPRLRSRQELPELRVSHPATVVRPALGPLARAGCLGGACGSAQQGAVALRGGNRAGPPSVHHHFGSFRARYISALLTLWTRCVADMTRACLRGGASFTARVTSSRRQRWRRAG
jgi:hypothetical protein